MNNKKGTLLRRQFYGEENDECKSKLVRASIIEDKTLKTLFAPRQPYPILGEFYYAPGEFFHSSDFFDLLERFRDNEEDQGRLSDGGIARTDVGGDYTRAQHGLAYYLAGPYTGVGPIDPPELFFNGIDDTNSLYLNLKDPSNEKWPKKSKLVKIEKVVHIYYNVNYTHGAFGGTCARREIKEEFYTKLIEDAIDIESQLQEYDVYTNYHLNQNTPTPKGVSGIYFDIVPTILNNFFPNFGPFINPVQLVIVDMKGGYGRQQDGSAGSFDGTTIDHGDMQLLTTDISVNGPKDAQKNAENYAQNRESLVNNLLEKFDKFKLIVTKDSEKGTIQKRIDNFENYYIEVEFPENPEIHAASFCHYADRIVGEPPHFHRGQAYHSQKGIEQVKAREAAFEVYFQTYCSAMGYEYLDGNSGVVSNIKQFFGIS